ncbi:hypothetical protein RFI_05265 [Reticulomyxa filosa]|uniref:Peptidase S54 rhomboid domain-containing protein n=1 Tax=Reticulomyxa filosa TaxID=46433 RepID=X6P2R6_RETFI|nr:hypothetical protein RFI_05265 [Reticulomyxa filosa]|eukprot:ETO31852.1 hypothetical protein RFI_05265 [Reticulomyxa filosa]
MPRSDRRRDTLPLLLLLSQLREIGLDNVPPVTLLIFVVNVAVHLFVYEIGLDEVCLIPVLVFNYHEYIRIFLSPFFHGDNWHLYYNMVSLLWKGKQLEESPMGSNRFLFFVLIAIPATSILHLAIAQMASSFFGADQYVHQCCVGFSGILFAMKVILTYNSPGYAEYWGLHIPMKYLAWFELVLIQMVTPNASLLGHLCGILVGLLYVRGVFNLIFRLTDRLPINNILAAFRARRHAQHQHHPYYEFHYT